MHLPDYLVDLHFFVQCLYVLGYGPSSEQERCEIVKVVVRYSQKQVIIFLLTVKMIVGFDLDQIVEVLVPNFSVVVENDDTVVVSPRYHLG